MVVRSASLTGEPRVFGTTPVRIFEAEAGRTAVVRSVIISPLTGTARIVWLQWGDATSGADFWRVELPVLGHVALDTWWVVPELTSIWVRTTTGTASSVGMVLVSGAYLLGVVT